jgi:hypothetical protein
LGTLLVLVRLFFAFFPFLLSATITENDRSEMTAEMAALLVSVAYIADARLAERTKTIAKIS